MTFTAFDTRFVQLTCEIDKLIDGYIDAYTGPAELKAIVQAAPTKEPTALLEEMNWLCENIPTADEARFTYLTAVLRAITCTLHLLRGDSIPYLEEVQCIFDINPVQVEESRFTAVHHELDTLLPGHGSIAARLDARRQRYALPADKILPMLELARNEARRRTLALLDLPDDNGVDITLTSSQPWSAYNWFQGNGRSHIEFNTDIPISALGLIDTFAHEGYPGHHTEGTLKERIFLRDKGYAETAVALLHSPAAVIAEGIATTAVEIIFPHDTCHEWNVDVLLPAAGIATDETAVQMRQIAQASKQLEYVSSNAAILYHTGQLNQEQVIDYIITYGLRNQDRATKSFGFFTHPLFRSYVFTYTQGYSLIQQAAGNNEKFPIFQRLLTEQLLPSQLGAMA